MVEADPRINIEEVCQTFGQLRADAAENNAFWDYLLRLTLPRKAYTETSQSTQGLGQPEDSLYDTTGVESVQILAAGHATYITPPGEKWMALSPPSHMRGNDEAENYFARCSEIMLEHMAASNFYATIHEVYLDRSAVGTGAMMVRAGKRTALQFDYLNIGDYSLAEDDEGNIDTIAREFQWTPSQIVGAFGEDNLSDEVRAAYGDPKKRFTQRFKVCQLIRPRAEFDMSKRDAKNMPFESVYFLDRGKEVLREEGFWEFPVMATRYLLWGKDQVYGVSPARKALPSIQQLQYLQQMQDTLVELMGFPRVLKLAEQAGEVDLRAGGVTKVSSQFANMNLPREWATSGRPDVIDARIAQKQDDVRRLFHVPLFQMWASIEQQMTATEATFREREKLLLFSPTFVRLIVDMRPMLMRIFGLLTRQGLLPRPPEVLLRAVPGGVAIDDPEVLWQSKIALALKQLGIEGTDRMMARAASIAQFDPDVLDNFDMDKAVREMARTEGVPMDFMRDYNDVLQIREAKAAAAAQQQQVENAPAMAAAAKDAAEVSDKINLSGLGL